MTQQSNPLQEAQDLLIKIYSAIGYTKASDIPDKEKREHIYAVWREIEQYLEKENVNLVF
jgi:hypothetical protein